MHAALSKQNATTGLPFSSSVMNMFNDQYQVVFTPYATAAKYTDPSYHLPAFYRVWATVANGSNAFWASAETAARSYFATAADPTTALSPDYSTFDGRPTGSGQNFKFDACWEQVERHLRGTLRIGPHSKSGVRS